MTGTDSKHTNLLRFVPVHELYQKLTREQHAILMPIYCLTGCDTTSSFFSHGKRTAFNLLQKADQFQGLSALGTGPPKKEEICACVHFVGALYGKASCPSIDMLRCELATRSSHPKKLPPTENALKQHILRCTYQLAIWRQATIGQQVLPDPTQYGWESNETTKLLHPIMMTQPCAAPELLIDIVCECSAESCHENCCCLANEQSCTADCACNAMMPGINDTDVWCTNPMTLSAAFGSDDSDLDD